MRLQLPDLPLPLNDLSPVSPLIPVSDPSLGASAAMKFICRNASLIPNDCKETPFADGAPFDEGNTGEKDAFMRFISRNLCHLQNLSPACAPIEEEKFLRSATGVSMFSMQNDAPASPIIEPPTIGHGYESAVTEKELTSTDPNEALLPSHLSAKISGQGKVLTASSPTESYSTASELSPVSSCTSRSTETDSMASEPSPRQTYRGCWEESEMRWEEASNPFCLISV